LGSPKKAAAVAGEFTVELKYKPVGHDNEPMVGGKVNCQGKDDLSDYSIEFIQNKTRWSSGRIRLKPDGVFMTNLFAEVGDRNIYRIELTNTSGEKQKVSPDELAYTIGAVVEEQPIIHSIGVGLTTNQVEFFFEKGRGLPQRKTVDFQTVQPLRVGQNGELIRIPIVEGENELADRNRLIDTIEIRASNIRREVPTGSEIELTLSIDTSRILRAKAYVKILDEEFEAVIDLTKRTTPQPAVLAKECEAEMNRIRTLRTKAETADGQTNQETLNRIEASNLLAEIKETMLAAGGVPDAAEKCEKRLLELKVQLDELADKVEWPALLVVVREWIGYLERAAEKHATAAQLQRAERATAEAEETIKEKKLAKLQRKLEEIQRAYYNIVTEQPGWWVYQLQQAEKQLGQMSDQKRGERLLSQGQECLAKNNVTGLQNVVKQLWDLLPSELAEAAKRGFRSGVVK
jgi:molecular chaperone DnaK